MSAQIIPFPTNTTSIRARATRAVAELRRQGRVQAEIECDPIFRAWCAQQDEQAKRAGQALPLYDDLRTRYLRGER